MRERAHPDQPEWGRRFGVLPTPGLRYVQWRYSFARNLASGRRVLDVPCGTGIGLPYLRRASSLIAMDRDAEALEFAGTRYRRTGAQLVCGDMTNLPLPDRSFDLITCMEGIEHLSRPDGIRFMSEAARVLDIGGRMLISCPISVDSRHSWNEYHLYEWEYGQLVSRLGTWFTLRRSLVRGGPDFPVVLLMLETRHDGLMKSASDAVAEDVALRIGESQRGVRAWIDRRWSGDEASYAASEPASFLATCFAVLAEETIGTLGGWTTDRRDRVARTLGSSQSPSTGLFGTELLGRGTLTHRDLCDAGYLELQMTYFGLAALASLDARPPFELEFARRFLDASYSIGWLEGGPRHDIWNLSNRVMFLLRFLIELSDGHEGGRAMDVFDAVIGWLLRTQDSDTGLWLSRGSSDVRTGVYASYHFLPFLFWRGVGLPHAKECLDSVLSVQAPDGLFGTAPGGGACEDLDAIDVLVKLSLVTDYRLDDVERALTRARDRILQIQKPDGGFPNHFRPPASAPEKNAKSLQRRAGEALRLDVLLNKPYRPPDEARDDYSGWSEVGATLGDADMWGAWFRPLALVLISSRFPHLGELPTDSRFQRLPCLGWHDAAAVVDAVVPVES